MLCSNELFNLQMQMLQRADEIQAKSNLLAKEMLIRRQDHCWLSIEDELLEVARTVIRKETYLLDTLYGQIERLDFFLNSLFEDDALLQSGLLSKSNEKMKDRFIRLWKHAISNSYKKSPKRGRTREEITLKFTDEGYKNTEHMLIQITKAKNEENWEACSEEYLVKFLAWSTYVNPLSLNPLVSIAN